MAVIHPPFPSVPDGLPAGVVVRACDGFTEPRWAGRPILWLTADELPDASGLWTRLYGERGKTGLYPLLLSGLSGDTTRPWLAEELGFVPVDDVDEVDPGEALADLWDEYLADDGPAGAWPGLAAPGAMAGDPDEEARELALFLGERRRVGLVPVDRGADALAMSGWDGPCNHTNAIGDLAAVVRSWEDRFGARVVEVGFDTLNLSVAAPPATVEHARAVAAEHYAFCPDNIDQSGLGLDAYADALVDTRCWTFWWD
jgi:hypothetical protein